MYRAVYWILWQYYIIISSSSTCSSSIVSVRDIDAFFYLIIIGIRNG